MAEGNLTLALIHEVFFGDAGAARLGDALARAREAGGELALLPELPFDRWIPATREVAAGDAEPPDGPRRRLLREAARTAGIAVLGGAIVEERGARRNRALLADASGRIVAHYDKLHVPQEEGFWERDHYAPGDGWCPPYDGLGLRLGLQICSDVQRPQLATALAALGAEVIVAPRATPAASHERWRAVLRALAIACAAYVVSMNRPRAEGGVPIGSPSLAFAPDGELLEETVDPLTMLRLERSRVEAARRDYPGYLDVRAELYARIWTAVART